MTFPSIVRTLELPASVLPKKSGLCPEIPFETDDSGAHPSGADAIDEPAGINRIRQLTSGVAAEVRAPKWCNQAIGSGRRRGQRQQKQTCRKRSHWKT